MNWDELARHISAAVGAADGGSEESAGSPAVQPLRLVPAVRERAPVNSSPIRWWFRSPLSWAAAASVLVAVGIGARLLPHTPRPVEPTTPVAVMDVPSLQPEQSAGTAVAEVQIGPPKQLAQGGIADMGDEAEDGVVSSPPRAFVASGQTTPGDAEVLPAMPF